ncbi:MAG: hypothetical protein CBB71_19415 [Rhodopirellula sp. TMED11]|nr:MAG: hypothetical protein CBB71_19415 [Rhodopirellula sp. TMED11]
MNVTTEPQTNAQASAWRLWIDGCGGFGLLVGNSFTLGQAGSPQLADVRVRADWPRQAGEIVRSENDYLWHCREMPASLLVPGQVVPVAGSAQLQIHVPSSLSQTAVLTLQPPHRFDDHIDRMLLVDQTILIGPEASNHIRCRQLEQSFLLVYRNSHWKLRQRPSGPQNVPAKQGLKKQPQANPWIRLTETQSIVIDEVAMMIEPA